MLVDRTHNIGWQSSGVYKEQAGQNKVSLLAGKPHGGQPDRVKAGETALSKAAEVYISAQGRKLSDDLLAAPDAELEDILTPLNAELARESKEQSEIREKKERIKGIDKQLESQGDVMTDDEKQALLKEKATLEKASKTDDDRLAEAFAAKRGIEKKLEDDNLTSEEAIYYGDRLAEAESAVQGLQYKMYNDNLNHNAKLAAANQEEADALTAELKDNLTKNVSEIMEEKAKEAQQLQGHYEAAATISEQQKVDTSTLPQEEDATEMQQPKPEDMETDMKNATKIES